MNTQSLLYLTKILDEVSSHPVLRAKERMVAAHQRGGFEELVKATEKRINATKDRDKLEGIAEALKELAGHPIESSTKTRLQKLIGKVQDKLTASGEAIAALDATLALSEEELREDALVEYFVQSHLEACLSMDEDLEAFEEVVIALADYACAAGMFEGIERSVVEQALADELVEFLPTLMKGAAALGRGIGATAGGVTKAVKAVGRGVTGAVRGAGQVGSAFKAGLKQGYKGEPSRASKREPDREPVKAKASSLAKKVVSTAAKSKLAGASSKTVANKPGKKRLPVGNLRGKLGGKPMGLEPTSHRLPKVAGAAAGAAAN